MASFNKVLLLGNLTRDPELRSTANGTAICAFGIATSRSYKGQDGEMKEDTTFVDIEAYGRQAEVVHQYFTKGKPIFIEGRLRFNQWEDKSTGTKRSKLTVTLEQFQFIGGRNDSFDQSTSAAAQESQGQTIGAGAGSDQVDDDVPF